MKILFLTIYPESFPSTRFRICQYFPYLEKEKIRFKFSPSLPWKLFNSLYGKKGKLRKGVFIILVILKRIIDFISLPFFHVVVIQKGIMPFSLRWLEKVIRILSRRIIFDIDDAVYLNPDTSLPKFLSFFEDRKQVEKIMKLSDMVVVGNNNLEKYARKFNKKVVVLPTPVDTQIFKPSQQILEKDKITVGWIGSKSTNKYVNFLIPVLNKLNERINLEFLLCSNSIDDILIDKLNIKVNFLPWSFENEKTFFQKIDIGVMPLPDNEWERCKCGLKLLQYMASGIPSVASPVGINKEIIKDGENGFLAKDEKEWIDKLFKVCMSDEIRKKFAKNGRKTVEEKYSVNALFPAFLKIIKGENLSTLVYEKLGSKFYDEEYFEGKNKSGYSNGYSYETVYHNFEKIASYLLWKFNPKRVLDIGCAKEYLVLLFKNKGIESYGVDISEYAISHAPEKVKKFLFKVDIEKEKLPFPDNFFDGITIIEVLEHLYNFEFALKECKRVLKKGGFLFVTTPFEDDGVDISHINVHPRDFWIEKISGLGFIYHDEKDLRKEIIEHSLKLPPKRILGKFLFNIPGGKFLRKIVLYFTHRKPWKWMIFTKK